MKFKWSDIMLSFSVLITTTLAIIYLLLPGEIQSVNLVDTEHFNVVVREDDNGKYSSKQGELNHYFTKDSNVEVGDEVEISSGIYEINYKKLNMNKTATVQSTNKQYIDSLKKGDRMKRFNEKEKAKYHVVKEDK